MGVVYKAEDTKLKREVAIKFLPRFISANKEEHQRFEIEAQAAAAPRKYLWGPIQNSFFLQGINGGLNIESLNLLSAY